MYVRMYTVIFLKLLRQYQYKIGLTFLFFHSAVGKQIIFLIYRFVLVLTFIFNLNKINFSFIFNKVFIFKTINSKKLKFTIELRQLYCVSNKCARS